MDKHINRLIEKVINKPITGYQRELIKVGLLSIIGLVISFYNLVEREFANFDLYFFFITSLYPIGFYYGWRTVFKMLRGNGSDAAEVGIITALFSGNGLMGFMFGMLSLFLLVTLSICIGWIVGFFNLFKILKLYKMDEHQKVA